MVAAFGKDVRYALRAFLNTPRFTIPAVLALALGIGATSAIFSIVRGVMLQPLPYRDPERIVSIWETNVSRNQTRGIVAPANFVVWRERARSFSHLGMVGPSRLNLMLDGRPYEAVGQQASADVFRALGAEPARGRTFTPDEDERGNDDVILLGHEFWRARLGGRSDVVGSTLVADGRSRTVVGVMPAAFTIEGQRAEFYVPYGWQIEQMRTAPGRGISHAIARLRDGVTLAAASDEMATLAAELQKEAPRRNANRSVTLVPIHDFTVEGVRPALLLLSGAVVLVLLVACVNVANLLLARSTVRQRELAVRTALGASRSRLFGQMLAESLLLSVAGGAAGLVMAYIFHRGLLVLIAERIPVPRLDQAALDLPVIVFTVVTSLLTGLLFGVLPALVATSAASDGLREGGRHGAGPRARRALGTLVVVEVALSLILLTGAGLLIRSFVKLQGVDPGFRPAGLLTGRVTLPAARYPETSGQLAVIDAVLARLRTLPTVASAAGVGYLPMAGPGIGTSFYRLDRPQPPDSQTPATQVRPVTPGFFRTMGIPQLAGRDFADADHGQTPAVAIISEGLARSHFRDEDPIGKRLHVNAGRPPGIQAEIVGIVGDIKFNSLDTDSRVAVYVPHRQLSVGQLTFVLRTAVEPVSLAPTMAGIVREIDPELPLADVRPMQDVVEATLARPRTVSTILTAFAVIALVLAGVGVYGVMAYTVSQRTREIGVRMALGATARSVFTLVSAQAFRLVSLGIVIGLVAAAALSRLLESLLFQTERLDPVAFGGTALVLLAVAGVASFLPSWRATRVAPTMALRSE